ncbi:hypothetical protein BGX24_000305 [Mortierella sp. AD032]|nr:hypothetical protein BGX24_000305 [Mortierella sp. AD032]
MGYNNDVNSGGGGGGFSFTGFPTNTGSFPPAPTGGSGGNSGNTGGNSTTPPPEKSGSNTGLYAGIGAGVGVVVLGVALFFWQRNRKNKKPAPVSTSSKTDHLPPTPAILPVHNSHQQQPTAPAVPHQYQYQPAPPPPQPTAAQYQYPDQQHASPTHSFMPEPTPTMPSIKDPKALEEYKHQQFILEHQRLQQRQELELETKLDQENLGSQGSTATLRDTPQQQSDCSLSLGDTSTTINMAASAGAAGRLMGHVAIATALVPLSPLLSPSAMKDV